MANKENGSSLELQTDHFILIQLNEDLQRFIRTMQRSMETLGRASKNRLNGTDSWFWSRRIEISQKFRHK